MIPSWVRRRRGSGADAEDPTTGPPPQRLGAAVEGLPWAAALPIPFTAVVAAVCLLPAVRANSRATWAVAGAAAVLAAWHGALWLRGRRLGRRPAVAVVVRAQHYVQACAQGAVLVYWGFYWREVYDAAPLLVAQVAFACGVDLLLGWSRRGVVTLGFGPLPVVFSINLFLWFRPDWFALQFLLIAGALAGRELFRWKRDGRRVHVFNPSSLALGAVSVVLLASGGTGTTWGPEIAATLGDAPHIYAVIVLASLPGQALFGVATMTIAAAVTLYAFGLGYFALTGTYWFVDAYIPIAVFLGMHLLITDPSTSPRTEPGRIAFGALYALSVAALYALLVGVGAPAFYDKLLAVPLLNLAVRGIDRFARGPVRRWDRRALAPGLAGGRRRAAWAAVWVAVFLGMSSVQAVGDNHRGQWVTFWAGGVRRRPAARLPARRAAHRRLLRRRIGLGLQRVRRPRAAGAAPGAGGRTLRTRLRARLPARLRQPRPGHRCRPGACPAGRRRSAHRASRTCRPPREPVAGRAPRGGLRAGVRRPVRAVSGGAKLTLSCFAPTLLPGSTRGASPDSA